MPSRKQQQKNKLKRRRRLRVQNNYTPNEKFEKRSTGGMPKELKEK